MLKSLLFISFFALHSWGQETSILTKTEIEQLTKSINTKIDALTGNGRDGRAHIISKSIEAEENYGVMEVFDYPTPILFDEDTYFFVDGSDIQMAEMCQSWFKTSSNRYGCTNGIQRYEVRNWEDRKGKPLAVEFEIWRGPYLIFYFVFSSNDKKSNKFALKRVETFKELHSDISYGVEIDYIETELDYLGFKLEKK